MKAYGPIGQCIYCGGREHLSREHIIPYGLHGNLVIQEACCAHCRDVTSALEGRILRGALLPMRTKRKFPTRHKDRRPEKFTISIQRGEETELIEVSPDDHPAIFGIPIFRPPAFRNDPNYQEGTTIIGEETLRFGDKPQEIMRRFDAEGFEVRTSYKPSEFARLIGKIGYSFVVACMGIDAIKESFVLSAVLGTTPDIGRWVGSCDHQFGTPAEDMIHQLAVRYEDGKLGDKSARILVAVVRLFASSGTTPYEVIVGTAATA